MRMFIAVLLSLVSSVVLADPCDVVVLHNPGKIEWPGGKQDVKQGHEFLTKVIAAGGRVQSVARVDLPMATSGSFAAPGNRKNQITLIWTVYDDSSSDPLDLIDPGKLYGSKRPAPDGIGKIYMGREISQVMGHLAANWLERPEREQEERTDLLVELMEVDPDDVIADIGSGSGYFTLRMAPRVPEGRAIGVDIQPEMNAILLENARKQGIENVETILGEIDDVKIPDNTVDVVLLVDAYHEFSNPWEMKRSMLKALKPGGRVVLVEYREEDPTVMILPHHKMSEKQARLEFESAGFRWITTHDELPQQHVLIFEKPMVQPTAG